jgi:hypothetical protein
MNPDFVHDLVRPPLSGPDMLLAEQQDRKAAALAVIEDLRRQLAEVTAERDKFKAHSITLNTIGWKIADALHELPAGAESAKLDPVDALDRLIGRYVAATNNPLLQSGREALIKLHDWDELIFGGFICTHCTPADADDPADNVYWPCQQLRVAGMDDEEAKAIIVAHRAKIEEAARA